MSPDVLDGNILQCPELLGGQLRLSEEYFIRGDPERRGVQPGGQEVAKDHHGLVILTRPRGASVQQVVDVCREHSLHTQVKPTRPEADDDRPDVLPGVVTDEPDEALQPEAALDVSLLRTRLTSVRLLPPLRALLREEELQRIL